MIIPQSNTLTTRHLNRVCETRKDENECVGYNDFDGN